MPDEETIGDRIKKLVRIAGSQKALARLAGISDATLINWSRGLGLRDSKIREAAESLGVSSAWLQHGTGIEERELFYFSSRINSSPGNAREKLVAAMQKNQLTVPALAKLIHHDAGILNNVINGTGRASERMIEAIIRVLPELQKEDLMSGSEDVPIVGSPIHGVYGQKPSVTMPPGRMVPVLSMAQAGTWGASFTDEGYRGDSVFAPNVDDRRAFAIRVVGNSMEDALFEGDYAICSPEKEIKQGECAVIRTRDEHAYIKFWKRNGDSVTLESANKDYGPIKLPFSEIAGVWPMVQFISARKIKKN